MNKNSIIGLVLTYNEEQNINDCINSLSFCDEIIVFDSFSSDKTKEISINKGAKVIERHFDNYASQRNAALSSISDKYKWVLMIDADERVTPELKKEILNSICDKENKVCLYRLRRKDHFMGKWIKRSSGYPTWFPRLFKNGEVTVEREINEEYLTNGQTGDLKNHLIHYPFNKGLHCWIEKHNKYSTLEAQSLLKEFTEKIPWGFAFAKDALLRRKFQKQFIYRLPFRPLIIFILFYFIKGGVFDGNAGYQFCRLRYIYEIMIDAKISEIKSNNKTKN